jgi:hypothetical protein
MPVRRTTAPDRLGGGFWRLFTADTVSSAGTVVSTLAIQFLLIDTLRADEQASGWSGRPNGRPIWCSG